ncbi:hypothetical protein [Streptomyces sp. CMB-StM0423]|uniref:hypothetical protein n=1 Tax=Streptomyces sp. CMB-StM0423 TaxID=2059884 RepID=UPI000C6FE345|nr:hypothetical protein [Streptomyces sp. CMB-StM0423]AUH43691.1 hypothetical protein CXR04_29085 [Streptomyces sp. CMB-StM0423]
MDVTDPHPTRTARALRLVAAVACLPYLSLKTAWIAGSTVGIPAGSELLEKRGTMAAVNSLTVLMDAAVIVLAFALTRPWGRRIPAWLVVLPLWVATGLLTPIVVGFPLQAVIGLFGGGAGADDGEPFLDEWVFTVVYTGFGVQALALGWLFALYVRDRWGHLVRGRLAGLPPSPTGPAQRVLAVLAVVVALPVAGLHLSWALGSTAGLSGHLVGQRSANLQVNEAIQVAFALAAAAGAVLLAHRPRPHTRLATAVALGWTGGAALAAWSGWMLLASLVTENPVRGDRQPTQPMNLAYAGGMITGLLVLAVGATLLAERAAAGRDVAAADGPGRAGSMAPSRSTGAGAAAAAAGGPPSAARAASAGGAGPEPTAVPAAPAAPAGPARGPAPAGSPLPRRG